jgi:hypothetical protein
MKVNLGLVLQPLPTLSHQEHEFGLDGLYIESALRTFEVLVVPNM